tara:strand:- start:5 stop:292 length:288 start_codon:yes stop_codon:yes gene_type:complete
MNYTDTQLKQALAKMLPEKVYMNTNGGSMYHRLDGKPQLVIDTELLHLCHQVELTLSWPEYSLFKIGLVGQLLRVESASWQQRVEALAEVKGIEI